MNREKRMRLVEELRDGLRAYQQAVDALDESAAERLGINRSDLRCLDVLMQEGASTPTRLAERVGLTSGSVTTMIDRLERAGYVARSADSADRRRTLVRATAKAESIAMEIYGPLAAAGDEDTAGYSLADFQLLIGFLSRGRSRHEERLRRLVPVRSTGSTRPRKQGKAR